MILFNSSLIDIPKRIPMSFRLWLFDSLQFKGYEADRSDNPQKKKILRKSVQPVHLYSFYHKYHLLCGDQLTGNSSLLFTRCEHHSSPDNK